MTTGLFVSLALVILLFLLLGALVYRQGLYRLPPWESDAHNLTRYGATGRALGTASAEWFDTQTNEESGYKVFDRSQDVEINATDLLQEVLPADADRRFLLNAFGRLLDDRRSADSEQISSHLQTIFSSLAKDDVLVSILVDHSGSMRGEKARTVAISLALLAEALQGVSANLEVLGFTTRSWQGGVSRKRWLASGRPKNPGRLCDLMHIIYKSWDDDAGVLLRNLQLMFADGVLRENVDGEAILWAVARSRQARCRRNYVIVMSDGAPVDDSTLHENDQSILLDHLKLVIQRLNVLEGSGIAGLGVCHDVSQFYPLAVSTKETREVFPALVDLLNQIHRVTVTNGPDA